MTDVLGDGEITMDTADLEDPREARAAERAMRYAWELGGYAMVRSSRPQSLGMPLSDSPVGLMNWLVERFRDWSAAQESPEEVLSRDEIVTTISLYWHFAGWEQPGLMVEDLRVAARELVGRARVVAG